MTKGDEPVRTCVGCRVRAPKSDLLRVVAVADESGPTRLVLDPLGRLPGRGAHVHREPACVDLAERRRAFARALRLTSALDVAALREQIEEQRQQTEMSTAPSPNRADPHDERSMSQHR